MIQREAVAAVGYLLLHHVCYCYVDYVAPTESLCDDLIPPVRQRKRQEDVNQYYTMTQWVSDDELRIIMLGTLRYRMKGYLIQVRKNNTVYGEFRPKHGAVRIDCPPGKRNTIYFIQANYTPRMNCYWVTPYGFDHYKDKIYIFATVLKKLSKYWLSVEPAAPRYPILPNFMAAEVYDSQKAFAVPS